MSPPFPLAMLTSAAPIASPCIAILPTFKPVAIRWLRFALAAAARACAVCAVCAGVGAGAGAGWSGCRVLMSVGVVAAAGLGL